jgi:hypothetical protein
LRKEIHAETLSSLVDKIMGSVLLGSSYFISDAFGCISNNMNDHKNISMENVEDDSILPFLLHYMTYLAYYFFVLPENSIDHITMTREHF